MTELVTSNFFAKPSTIVFDHSFLDAVRRHSDMWIDNVKIDNEVTRALSMVGDGVDRVINLLTVEP